MELKKITEQLFPVSFNNLYEMLAFILKFAGDVGFDQRALYKLEIVVEEALVNVIKYSGLTASNSLTIICQVPAKQGIQITIRDTGKEYNPLNREKVDVKQSIAIEDRKIGGFGVHLIREIMDAVDYRYENGENIFILTKYLPT